MDQIGYQISYESSIRNYILDKYSTNIQKPTGISEKWKDFHILGRIMHKPAEISQYNGGMYSKSKKIFLLKVYMMELNVNSAIVSGKILASCGNMG